MRKWIFVEVLNKIVFKIEALPRKGNAFYFDYFMKRLKMRQEKQYL